MKRFLESAHPIVASNRRWWDVTLDLFLQARIGRHIDTTCILLNVLLDRIADKYTTSKAAAEIDHDLPAKVKSKAFKDDLHKLLAQLAPKWSVGHTAIILDRMKEINSRPPFGEAIARVCDKFGVSRPSKKLLANRHKLLYIGEFAGKEVDIWGYWDELDWLVTSLLLRMLGYEGKFYHRKFGSGPVELADIVEHVSDNGPFHNSRIKKEE